MPYLREANGLMARMAEGFLLLKERSAHAGLAW